MLKRIVTFLIVCVTASLIAAQGAPEAINAAVRDLSARVGTTLSVSNLEQWNWEQKLFADTSLDCPAAGQTYAQVQTAGYIFTIVYKGTTYSYHVSADQSIVVLCQSNAPVPANATPVPSNTTPTPSPTPTLDEQYINPLCPLPEADEQPYMRTRLRTGMSARATEGAANRLRDNAGIAAAQIGEIPGGAAFTVQAGPQCVDNILWWQVDYDGRIGWTAEGQSGEYFLEPVPAAPLPVRQPITIENADLVRELTSTQGNFTGNLTWASSGQTLALLGDVGSDSIWLYTPELSQNPPTFFVQDGTLTDVDFMPTAEQIMYATTGGEVHVLNLQVDARVRETLVLKTHEKNVVAAIQPDGTHFAAGGENAATNVNVDKRFALLYWDLATVAQAAVIVGHTAVPIDLQFSPDSTKLASLDANGVLLLTTLATPDTPKIFNQANYTAIAFSPNAQFVAAARANGAIDLIDTTNANGTVIATYTGHLSRVNALSFSADSTLLASVSDDGTLRIWSTQTDQQVNVIEVSEEGVQDVGFSPLGGLIATATDDGTLIYFGVSQ